MRSDQMKQTAPIKEQQTVTADGKSVQKFIDGLLVRPASPHVDRRGEVVEVYNPAWKVHPAPMVYAYQATVRPQAIKGWIVHKKQDDRIYTCLGVMRWVFYDDREKSPTYQVLNQFTFSDRNRALIVIPAGVYHAVQNVGEGEAVFFNLPTRPYDHGDPDKYRLPPRNDLIPFDFDDPMSW
jgi:dTDP-4-dehydrorhamnose 3,5-epimerase